ncbi:MAG: hypothetical protein CMD35_07390 [Flavobacteriales bacterium]|nr:hypothetical protein [Flavobacteriales bacterium]
MKNIAVILSIPILFIACENKVIPNNMQLQNEEKTFLSKYNKSTWTNGFETYTFDTNYSQNVDVVLPICDTCFLPTLECHMCGYTWMRDEIGKFSFGKNYQNDFFYEEDETQFYEDSTNSIYSRYIRGGFSETYESGPVLWVPHNEDSLIVEKVKLKNQSFLEDFHQKKREENQKIDEYIDENY